jgi:hypothetical protein
MTTGHRAERIEFSAAIKELIQERAGSRCSYPACGVTTTSASLEAGDTLRTGVAAHIYSAAEDGPRGRGGLSDEEIGQAVNGIWLCGRHAKMIDDNGGVGHPPATLLSYKGLHEARVQGEHLGIYPAVGWLHEVEFVRSPIFSAGAKARFGKLNLLYGRNATGKTTLWRLVLGAFDTNHLGSWLSHPQSQDVRVSYLRPQPTAIRMQIGTDPKVTVDVDGQRTAMNALPLRTICVTDTRRRSQDDNDDRRWFSTILGVAEIHIDGLAQAVDAFPHAKVRNLRFVPCEGGVQLRADVAGTRPGLPFRALSGREQDRVVIEFATAAARTFGRSSPTVLVIDFAPMLWDGWFDFFSHHLLDPENQFQTIMCIPEYTLNLNAVRWNGWEVIRTKGTPPEVVLTQEPRDQRT